MFKKYSNCIYCGSKKLKKEQIQKSKLNFYVQAIVSDLNLNMKDFRSIKSHKCMNCSILQNNPWFSEKISKKIYSNIYGQHHRNWSNILNFIKHCNPPNHGELFKYLNSKIKIKNYAEFKSPFLGILLNFFLKECRTKKFFLKNYFENIIEYLKSRQVVNKSKKAKIYSLRHGTKILRKISGMRKKNFNKKIVNKYLFLKNSNLSWGQNDNYKSVNSVSLASEFFNDLEIHELNYNHKKIKFDLFGLFHTLDHTFEPKKVLDYALDVSRYVVVYCHIDKELNRQHLFTFTKDFLNYLNRNKIYTLDITDLINKKYKSPEMYFLCSRKKKNIELIS